MSLREGHPPRWSLLNAMILPITNVLFAIGLFSFHVHAESNVVDSSERTIWERILLGPEYFTAMDKVLFVVMILLAMELLNYIAHNSGVWMNSKLIPVRGKHLDDLSAKDQLFIGISKAQTGPFVYFVLRYCFSEPNILWKAEDISMRTTLLPLPVFFLVFDFFYTSMHWALHVKSVYGWIHKHHHVQKAPSRANNDAVNVHPVEFFLGEYNHLWTLYLCCQHFGLQVHAISPLLFLAVGGLLAGWNHTRFDIEYSLFGITIFDSKAHDVHHRIPQSNYGQYTMFWDKVFGTYRPYDPKDRINPKSQLDPITGKSLEYTEKSH